jgi:hypothetical protein
MQRRCFRGGKRGRKGVGHEAGDLLGAQPQQHDMRRRRHPSIHGAIVRRRQVVGAKLHHIGGDAVEKLRVSAQYRPQQA